MQSKTSLRDEMRNRRRAVAEEARDDASRRLCAQLLARGDVRAALQAHKPAAVYLAAPRELDLADFIAALWEADVTVAVPFWKPSAASYGLCVYDNCMALVEGRNGILEPAEWNEIDPADVGMWIVPGLAFTADGARLGYGGGWFDKMLKSAAPDALTLGVGYSFQLCGELPLEPHDFRLRGIETVEVED